MFIMQNENILHNIKSVIDVNIKNTKKFEHGYLKSFQHSLRLHIATESSPDDLLGFERDFRLLPK